VGLVSQESTHSCFNQHRDSGCVYLYFHKHFSWHAVQLSTEPVCVSNANVTNK